MKAPILESKLRPVTNGHLLYRERLVDQLSKNESKRLLVIEAHSGSGKSTLAAQFLKSRSLESAWYNLDAYDQDPALFFDYLTMAIRGVCPGFCQGPESRSATSVEGWTSFIQELQDRVKQPLFVVLDNFECINGSKGVNRFLVYLVQHLPALVHLMILTCQRPHFSLSHLRLSNDLCVLRASDLAFTLDEALRAFQEVYGTALPESVVRRIVEDTDGWAMALGFIGHNAAGREVATRMRRRSGPEAYKEDMYEYFLEEVLKSVPLRIRELMISSALLPLLSAIELKGYLGPENAELLLKSIRRSNMPVSAINGGTGSFKYNNLFRKFLLNKLYEQKPEFEVAQLLRQAAQCLEKNYPLEAIEHYLSAGEVEKAVAMLEKVGWDLLRQGRFETLKVLLNRVPLEERGHNPVMYYYLGRIQEIHGDVEGARAYYQQAMEGLGDEAQDAKAACKARLGILEYKMDRFREARKIFDGALAHLEKADIREDIAKRLISTHANLAKVYCKLEEMQKTSEHLRQAQSFFDLYGKPEDEVVLLQARTQECVLTGRFPEVLRLGNRGKDLCRKFGFERAIPIFNHYLAFAHTYMGDFQEARVLAENGLALLREQGVEDCINGALLAGLGHCQLAGGDLQNAVRTFQESTNLFKKTHNFCGQFWNDSALSLLAARQGDLSEAWDYWRKMERNSRELALPLQHAMTLIVEALLSAMEQGREKTVEKLGRARRYLNRSGQRMSVFHGIILMIKAYEIIGRHDLAGETFLENISPGEPSKYYYAVHYELEWFLPFFSRLMQKNPDLSQLWAGVMPGPSRSGVADVGTKVSTVPVHTQDASDGHVDLHFYVLGPFRVTANGRAVPLERSPSKKALTLLRYLFFKRHEGGVVLDEALELLWPEMDPRVTRSNLRVILSMLRKVFRRPGNGSQDFPNLIREGNKLKLSLGKSGWSDVDEFMNQVKLAGYKEKRNLWSEALKHYEKIVDLYRGDFLSEELYADWCAMERQYLKDQYVTSLMRMVHCYEQLGNPAEAIGALYRVLKMDKYREDAYQRLMALCASSGRKGEMTRAYGLCRKAIEEDLNMELSVDTRNLYARLSSRAGQGANGSLLA